MKYLQLILLSSFLLLVSCGKKPQPMAQSHMVNILKDVHIAETLINSHHPIIMKDSLEKLYLAQVLEKWKTSSADFEIAMQSMNADPDYMREVYEMVKEEVAAFSKQIDESPMNSEEMFK